MHAPALGMWKQKDQKHGVILTYRASLDYMTPCLNKPKYFKGGWGYNSVGSMLAQHA